MNMVIKIMNEGNACFQHLKKRYKTYKLFHSSLAAKPNLVSRQVFSKKDSYSQYFSYATLAISVAVVVAV